MNQFSLFDVEAVINNNCEIADNIFEMKLKCDFAHLIKPGQFVNVLISRSDLSLRRPISVCEVNPNEIVLTFRIEGEGTFELAKMNSGESVKLLCPLGNGFNTDIINSGETALIIGGGIGTPPLLELAKRLNSKGVEVVSVLGFGTKSALIYQNEFEKYGKVFISTDDGSIGFEGNAISLLKNEFGDLKTVSEKFQAIYSCGPTPLLRAIDKEFKEHANAFVSLESRMACGIGACYACVNHIQGDDSKALAKKVCDQGPVFKTGEVIF